MDVSTVHNLYYFFFIKRTWLLRTACNNAVFDVSYRIADSRSSPRDGAYVHGLLMEGARWDVQAGIIMDSRLKDLFPPMPVIYVRVSENNCYFFRFYAYNFVLFIKCLY